MSIADKLQKESDKEYGTGVMTNASDLLQQKKQIVSVSPMIDSGLGGGIPEGSWVTISGPFKFGKTITALQIAANAQKLDKYVYFYAIEGRLKPRDLNGVHGLDTSKNFKIIQSTQSKILVAEDYLNHIIYTIKSHPNCVVVIDSGSALCSREEMENKITSQLRSPIPKLWASFCRQMCNVIPVQNTILVVTQHLIADTSGRTQGHHEDGGRKIQFQVDVKLRGKFAQQWQPSSEEKPIGQVLHWEIKSSALSGTPWTKVQSYLRYGYGLDEETELFHLANDFGLICQGGSWYSFDFMETPTKIQGETKSVNFLKENPDIVKTLYDTIKQMI